MRALLQVEDGAIMENATAVEGALVIPTKLLPELMWLVGRWQHAHPEAVAGSLRRTPTARELVLWMSKVAP